MTTPSRSILNALASPLHDHAACMINAIEAAERLCNERGVRLTPIRRKVLELIWESHKPVKAYDLLHRIKPIEAAAKPATVYRAIEFLMEQGLLHRVESLNAFVGCSCPSLPHEQLLLICVNCQQVEERPGRAVMEALAAELQEADFTLHRKAMEIHGICSACAAQERAAEN